MINKQITDWDSYYKSRKNNLNFFRKITLHYLNKFIARYCKNNVSIVAELGGASSCFSDYFINTYDIEKYYIIDNSKVGINKTVIDQSKVIIPILDDILSIKSIDNIDLVISVGLIEHFDVVNTAKCIKSHFDLLKKGGFVLLTFPTPTLLYRLIRSISQFLNLWVFHDERPLLKQEVFNQILLYGDILDNKTNWFIGLTQEIVIAQKK
jgi:SAM-dependent methyltransferase